MGSKARILHCGEQAFSVELADEIDENVNLRLNEDDDYIGGTTLHGVSTNSIAFWEEGLQWEDQEQ